MRGMSKLKESLCFVFVLVMLFVMVGCGSENNENTGNVSEETTGSVATKYKKYPSGTGIDFMEFGPLVPDAAYTTPAEENGLSGEVYMLMGSVEEYFFEGDYAYIRLNTITNGEVVIIDPVEMVKASGMTGTLGEIDYQKLRSYYPLPEVDEFITIFGEYQGFSEKFQCANFMYASENYLLEAIMLSLLDSEPTSATEEPALPDNQNETFEPVSGSGDDVVSGIKLGDGMYRLHIQYNGDGVFSVNQFDADGEDHLIVTNYGAYDGYVYLEGKSPITFEVRATGSWVLTVEPLKQTSKQSFAGDGDFVTDILTGPSGTWELTYAGDGVFSVFQHSGNRNYLIASSYGEYKGKKVIQFTSSGACFEITADAPWTLKYVG